MGNRTSRDGGADVRGNSSDSAASGKASWHPQHPTRRANWLRSAQWSLASFGALPSLPMVSWLMSRIRWWEQYGSPGRDDFSRPKSFSTQKIGPTEVGPTRATEPAHHRIGCMSRLRSASHKGPWLRSALYPVCQWLALRVLSLGNLSKIADSGATGCLQPVLVGESHWLQATSGTHFHGLGCSFPGA
jgi:hypothetical protein